MNKYKEKLLFTGAVLLLLLSILLSTCLGSVRISFAELMEVIQLGIGNVATPAARIFWYARLPRTAACVLSGAALAV